MLRLVVIIALLCGIGYGMWWVWDTQPQVRNLVEERLDTGEFRTLEVRYSPQQIMETNKKDLIGSGGQKAFLEPTLKFYPYLLMEIKYSTDNNATREGIILWGLEDGEMVIDTATWKKTHGFQDCIQAHADRNDFKVINVLAKGNRSITRKELLNSLHVEDDLADQWIDSVRKKKLIIQAGNEYRLHLQSPELEVRPETQMKEWLVTKPHKGAIRESKRFSPAQVERTAQAAFGKDFTIRSSCEVFLPIYSINVKNPDGSILTSYWNALNGQRLSGATFR